MTHFCAENERLKHKYFEWMQEAQQRTTGTIAEAKKVLHRFEQFTGCVNFKTFNRTKIEATAKDFKRHLRNTVSKVTGGNLSLTTMDYTIRHMKDFFMWLMQQPGYRALYKPCDIDYFNLSDNDKRIARAAGRREYPSIPQVIHVIENMPFRTECERRNRAILAFMLLSGVRDGALITLRMKHVNLEKMEVDQDPREVKTKLGKRIITWFFPVGTEALKVFADYYTYLKNEKLFAPDDPLFPCTEMGFTGRNGLKAVGLTRRQWSDRQRVAIIIKNAFRNAGLKPYPPHAIRHTLAALGEEICVTPEQWKAWSQNLGHTHTRTTFDAYGYMNEVTQEAQIRKFWKEAEKKQNDDSSSDMLKEVHKMMKELTEKTEVPSK